MCCQFLLRHIRFWDYASRASSEKINEVINQSQKSKCFYLSKYSLNYPICMQFNHINYNSYNMKQKQLIRQIVQSRLVEKTGPQSNGNLCRAEIEGNNQKPISIIFENISYSIEIDKKVDGFQLPCRKQKEKKQILTNLTGIVKAGEVSAILGASGAGKTTLLNILSCRVPHKSKGSLYANKLSYDYDSFGDFANYVMQTDVLMQTLTVRETLTFAADLKLDISAQQKKQRILELAKSMKLQNCLDVLVGGQLLKGISGGQKKRTSIAFELISDPQVIMLDQPTSGLDSLTSFIIVNYLSRLAHQRGRTVLMTIHQPNSDIYKKFDRLFLMVQGQFIYQGPSRNSLSYFAQNFRLICGQFVNPAQFQLQIMHHQVPENVQRFPQYFRTYQQKLSSKVSQQIQSIQNIQVTKRQNEISVFSKFGTLLKRDFTNITKNPMLFKMRLIQSFVLGAFIGGVFFQAGKSKYLSQTEWYTISGFCFILSIGGTMSALSPITLIFPLERPVFLKEQNARFYSVLPYFLSRSCIEIPYLILMPFILNMIVYWMVGLSATAEQFFMLYFTVFLINLCGNSLGLLLGSMIKDAKAVAAAVPLVFLPLTLFAGYFKNTNNLSSWVSWIQYISPMKYSFIVLLSNQVKNKESRIQELNFDIGYWPSVGILIGLAAGYRVISLFFLWMLRTRIE